MGSLFRLKQVYFDAYLPKVSYFDTLRDQEEIPLPSLVVPSKREKA